MWKWPSVSRHRNAVALRAELPMILDVTIHPHAGLSLRCIPARSVYGSGIACGIVLAIVMSAAGIDAVSGAEGGSHLRRARQYLAAGDYRRAIEACQEQINEAPSAESYVYLTYVYHALDGYLEHLSKNDRWVAVEQLYLNLAMRGPEDLTDPPDVLARIAKEIIQGSLRQQSDVTAAMAARLNQDTVARLWKQQTAWRTAKPESWWSGVPDEWNW